MDEIIFNDLEAKAEFENLVLKNEKCTGKELRHKVFVHARFDGCDCTKSNFTGSKFLECTWHSCNLSLVKIDGCRLQDVEFIDCKFVGVNFGKCDPMFLKLKFKGCLIDTCNFSDLDLKGILFQDCVLREAHFINAKLVAADFSGTDLQGTTFHNSDLSKANFSKAFNYSINPLTNKLFKARFSKPEVLTLLAHFNLIVE